MKRLFFRYWYVSCIPIIAIGISISPRANANEFAPRFSWAPPTEFESNTPLDPLTDLSEYRLYCTPSPQTPTRTLPNTDNEWQAPIGFFAPGTYTCHMTSVGMNGQESTESSVETFTVTPDKPGPLVIFEVN